MQLAQYQRQFAAMGVNVAALTIDRTSKLKSFSDRYGISYPLLTDRSAKHVNAFKVRNKGYRRGHQAYGVPHPGVLFIDVSGLVRGKAAVRGFQKRPSFEELLELVKEKS